MPWSAGLLPDPSGLAWAGPATCNQNPEFWDLRRQSQALGVQ